MDSPARGPYDRRIVDLVVEHGSLDRPAIARLAGVSRPSAGELVARLMAEGILEEVGERVSGRRGPNAILYSLREGLATVGGVEVQPGFAAAHLADVSGRELEKVVVTGEPDDEPESLVARAVQRAAKLSGISPDALRTVTVAAPGIVGTDGDMAYVDGHPAWSTGLRARLERALGVHVHLENDVKLAALAEQRVGAAQGADSYALLRCDDSVSSAVVLGGRVVRGRHGAAGEIGYLPSWSRGRQPASRLQDLLGTRELSAALADLRATVPDDVGAPEPTPEDVLAGRALPQLREPFLAEVSRRFTFAVAALCAVVDPELVVLAGPPVTAGGPDLADAVASSIHERTPFRPQVRLSALADTECRPAVRGALVSALDSCRDLVYGLSPVYLPAGPPLRPAR